jgi:hypothetical protein
VHPKHPKKEVNEALDYADKQGLRVERTSAGHKWGPDQVQLRSLLLHLVDSAEPSRSPPSSAAVG